VPGSFCFGQPRARPTSHDDRKGGYVRREHSKGVLVDRTMVLEHSA
jgi:hypothetical protein